MRADRGDQSSEVVPAVYRSSLDGIGLENRGSSLAGAPAPVAPPTEKMLLFRVAYMRLAIPLEKIRIVQRSLALLPFPEAPRNVIGLLELAKHETIPVVDLARSLGIRPAEDTRTSEIFKVSGLDSQTDDSKEHVIVYDSSKGTVGFLVDKAEAVVDAALSELPESLQKHDSSIVALARLQGIESDEDTPAYVIDLERHVP